MLIWVTCAAPRVMVTSRPKLQPRVMSGSLALQQAESVWKSMACDTIEGHTGDHSMHCHLRPCLYPRDMLPLGLYWSEVTCTAMQKSGPKLQLKTVSWSIALLWPGSMMIVMVRISTEEHMDAPVWAATWRHIYIQGPHCHWVHTNLSGYVATQDHSNFQAGTVSKGRVWIYGLVTAGVCVDFCGTHCHLEQLGSWFQLSGHRRTGPGTHQPPQWESCSLPQLLDPSGMAMGKLHRASMVLGELATSSFIG